MRVTYATVDPALMPIPVSSIADKPYSELDVGLCHLVVEEVSSALEIIVSMSNSETSDYVIPWLLPGAGVVLMPAE